MAGWMLAMVVAATPAAGSATPVPGTITVTLPADDDDEADQPFVAAVQEALGNASFTALPVPGHSRYVAEVSIDRRQDGIVTQRAGREAPQIGITAVRVPLPSKKTVLRGLIVTTLTIRIVQRADRQPVWTGRALTAQPEGAPVAAKLARAAVSAFPQTLAAPVSVP